MTSNILFGKRNKLNYFQGGIDLLPCIASNPVPGINLSDEITVFPNPTSDLI
jgi:hypothetical protein